MCKRKNPTDPLVRRFLQSYGVNLLPLPRRGAEPGELYVQTGRKVKATPGGISEVIEPDVRLPDSFTEPLPDMEGKASSSIDANFGLGLAGNFLAMVGLPPGVIDDVKLGYERSSTASVSFAFHDVTRCSIDPLAIGTQLIGRRFKQHPMIHDGNRYFVAASFVRSPAISIHAEDASAQSLEVGAGVAKLVDGEAGVSVNRAGDGTLTYRGQESLAIGVELYELEFDEQRGFLMGGQREPVALQRARDLPPDPAFPAEDDEALLYVEGPED